MVYWLCVLAAAKSVLRLSYSKFEHRNLSGILGHGILELRPFCKAYDVVVDIWVSMPTTAAVDDLTVLRTPRGEWKYLRALSCVLASTVTLTLLIVSCILCFPLYSVLASCRSAFRLSSQFHLLQTCTVYAIVIVNFLLLPFVEAFMGTPRDAYMLRKDVSLSRQVTDNIFEIETTALAHVACAPQESGILLTDYVPPIPASISPGSSP